MTGTWMSLLWFGAIIVLIPGALWLLKRSGYAGARGAGQGLQLDASLALGPQQRVVTVAVGEGEQRRWLVLGITPQQITALHVFDTAPTTAGTAAAGMPPAAAGFADLLAQWGRRPSGRAAPSARGDRGERHERAARRAADTRGDERTEAVIEARIRREIASRSRREPLATTVPADLAMPARAAGARDGV